jgi:hypothetical protein
MVYFVEFVIQILKKATKLRDAWGAKPPAVRIVLGFYLYKYLCKP